MALKAQQYQILKAKATKALGTSLLIIPELRVLVLTKRHVGSGNVIGRLEACFQNGGRRNSPAAFAALQMPDTFLPKIFLLRLHLFLRLVNVYLPVLTQKVFFYIFVTSKSPEPGFVVDAGRIANCLGKFLVENSILRRHFGQY